MIPTAAPNGKGQVEGDEQEEGDRMPTEGKEADAEQSGGKSHKYEKKGSGKRYGKERVVPKLWESWPRQRHGLVEP